MRSKQHRCQTIVFIAKNPLALLSCHLSTCLFQLKIGDKNQKDASVQPRRSNRKRQGKHGAGRDGRDGRDEQSSLGGKGHNYNEIVGQLVAGKFRLIKMLGSGSYGKFTERLRNKLIDWCSHQANCFPRIHHNVLMIND